METKKKKTSIKKVIQNLWKNIRNYFKLLCSRFNKLPKHIKSITCVWVLIVLLIVCIVFASTSNKKYLEEYALLESKVTDATLSYLEENNIYPLKDAKLKLSLDMLMDVAGLIGQDFNEKKCDGFSKSYFDDDKGEYVIKSFIKCDNYVTNEYSDYK